MTPALEEGMDGILNDPQLLISHGHVINILQLLILVSLFACAGGIYCSMIRCMTDPELPFIFPADLEITISRNGKVNSIAEGHCVAYHVRRHGVDTDTIQCLHRRSRSWLLARQRSRRLRSERSRPLQDGPLK